MKNFKDYKKESSKFEKINWWTLPESLKLDLNSFPKEIKKLGKFITIRRLKQTKQKEEINKKIVGIKKEMMGNKSFKINFPIDLKKKEYAQLYALITSEGSYRTEFSLNVPEKEFHDMFKNCIKILISKEAANLIRKDYNNNFLRSRAPAIIRHLIPFPLQIPRILLNNKNHAKEYLKTAFEAEGSAIYNKKKHKRYIKLSRYTDITPFVLKEKIPILKRIYLNELKKKYFKLFEKIKDSPPKLLEGESLLLKHHFDIDNKIQLEAIRKNKTALRCGKITARWILIIYANNIDKFIKEIGFISKRKIMKTKEMKKIKGNNPQYSTLNIIKKISKRNYFYRKDFIQKMKKLGYKSPSCYLYRYCKKGLIKRIKRSYFKILF